MSWRKENVKLWFIGIFFVAILTAAFYFIVMRGSKSSVTGQLLEKEQVVARAEASNLESFFQTFGNSIAARAQLANKKSPDVNTLNDMTSFVKQWQSNGMVTGIALTDSKGIVILNSNVSGTSLKGLSLADRDYFIWAKKQTSPGSYFVGQPVASRAEIQLGQTIVPVASPVFRNGVFSGVLLSSVTLKQLTVSYVAMLKISDQTDIDLIDKSGNIIYSSLDTAVVGSNLLDPSQKVPPFAGDTVAIDSFKSALNSNKEGKIEAANHIVAYSPVNLGSQRWLLIMASPGQNIDNVTGPIYTRQSAVLLLISLTFLLFGLIASDKIKLDRG